MADIEKEVNIEEGAKAYTLRELTADDIFPMLQIISKIGIKEFKSCFDNPEVKAAALKASAGLQGADADADLNSMGMVIAIDLAGIIISKLPDAKDDIYLFLAGLSGMTKKQIAALSMATFFEMIMDVIKKDEFKDFFKVVSRLLK